MADPAEDFEDDELDTVDEVDEEDQDEDIEPDEPDDEPDEPDDEPVAARAPARKPFSQRVEEVAAKRVKPLEAELERLRSQVNQPRGETQAQINERLAQMEPWEAAEYRANQRMAALEWNGAERLDKMGFAAICRDDPVARKLEGEVESRLMAMRANGQNVDRETLYTFILGERAKANRGRATSKAQKTAAASRDRQQARPSNSRGDETTADRRGRNADTPEARAKRLENQII